MPLVSILLPYYNNEELMSEIINDLKMFIAALPPPPVSEDDNITDFILITT